MIVMDMEVFAYDWMIVWLDTNNRKFYSIVNDKEALERFYEKYKKEVWICYNGRNYDQYIVKSILAGFNPKEMNDWIIEKDRKGFEFSNLLNKFPIITYDVMQFGRSLKQLEGFMGHSIEETTVPFDLQRKLTDKEINSTLKYCKFDVMETFNVFVETLQDYETNLELVKTYNLGLEAISKTQTQLTAMVLGANKLTFDDEFNIRLPDTLQLGKYEWLRDYYLDWARDIQDYSVVLDAEIANVPHKLAFGGLHGAKPKYFGDGFYILADVGSYYPSLMIEYDYFSRAIGESGKKKFKEVYNHRMELKAQGKKKEQAPYKLILNKTYGGLKDKYNALYDPVQANNICIAGQLLLVDLIDKIEHRAEIIQSNTDGVLFKVDPMHKDEVIAICEEWSKRTRMNLEYDVYTRIVQKDVNNYLTVDEHGGVKRIGSYVKFLSLMDNQLPIVNKALVNYFVDNIPVEQTIMSSNSLMDFQMITKVSHKYEFAFKVDSKGKDVYNEIKDLKSGDIQTKFRGSILNERVFRVFASTRFSDGELRKKHKITSTLAKTSGTPDRCFIDNSDITEKGVPQHLEKQWYVDLAHQRIKDFIG